MTGMYRHEIDKMKNISLDVAFVPLDPRQERRYADGILYFLQKVKSKAGVSNALLEPLFHYR